MKITGTCSKVKPHLDSASPTAAVKKAKNKQPDQCPCCSEIWGLAVGLALAFGMWYHLQKMNPKYSLFSPTDMIGVGDAIGGFTPYFCEALHISAASTFKAYRLNHSPEIDKKHREKFNESNTFVMETYDRVKRSFYLLEGSSVKVDVCIDAFRQWNEPVKALVFKGRGHFHKWDQSHTCDACAEQVHVISSRHSCRREHYYSFHFKAETTDNYYVALYKNISNQTATIVVHVKYDLQRSIYDIRSAELACKQGPVCDVKLDYASSQDVVVKFKKRNDDMVDLTTTCIERIYFWVIVFGVIPFSAAMLLSCCCCGLCGERQEGKGTRRKISSVPNKITPTLEVEAISGSFEKDRVLLCPSEIPTYA